MKNIIHKTILFAGLLMLPACNQFLDVEVLGKSDTETFFSELDGLVAALPGAYSVTYNFYDSEFLKYGDVAGNMLRMSSVSGTADMVNQYNFTSLPSQETGAVGYLWKRGYIVMSNVNNILLYAPALKEDYPHDLDEIDNIMAQAYFLRALMHLDLALCFAQPYNFTSDASHWGVPVMTKLPAAGAPVLRATMKKTYERILDDINLALNAFTDDYEFDPHYASPLACKALLARVYLYMGKWDLAEQYASEVIGAVPLTARENYVDMFAQNNIGDEAIFRLSGYNAGKSTGKFYEYGSAAAIPADTLYAQFTDDRDIRLKLLYNKPDTKKGKVCMKYYLKNITDVKQGADLFVFRTSEMYLIRAEARMKQNQLDDAADDIRKLEGRALGIDPDDVALDYQNAADLDRLIEIERIRELSFEGHRFFDLARQKKDIVRETGTNSSMKHLHYPDYRYALPISLVERDANPEIQQNGGYE